VPSCQPGRVEDHPAPLTIPRLLARGVWRRCPLCGGGDCFETWFQVKERCPRCHFPIQREEGHWIGAIGMNTVVSFGAILVTLVAGFVLQGDQRRVAPMLIALVAVAIIVPLAFFGSSQTLWSAIDLAMRPLEPADDVDPKWIPPPVKRS
jgi:uncharacterized protein (DUF983 family)